MADGSRPMHTRSMRRRRHGRLRSAWRRGGIAALGAVAAAAGLACSNDHVAGSVSVHSDKGRPPTPPARVAAVCEGASAVDVQRVVANPQAERLGSVVFTPLELLPKILPQPYPTRGAAEAHATKIGATIIGGVRRARVRISPRGAARLVYGGELTRRLGSGDIAWSALPSALVLAACLDDQGRPRATIFPGGLVFRDTGVCRVRLTAASRGVSVTRAFRVGFPRCRPQR